MALGRADEALLSLLRENARASTAEIARRLKLSRTTVQSRIQRLEQMGVIAGYTVRVGDDFSRDRIRALIMVTVLPKQMPAVVQALRGMPELRSLQSVSGPWDLVALAIVPTIGEMDELTDRIGAVLWFSDLRGYTRITDTAQPEQVIPLLNDYAEAVISAVTDQGGDVLKLIGDGTHVRVVVNVARFDQRAQAKTMGAQ